ncbi:MAG: aminopeptidase [Oscillospiraceae bacterium]|nr:aminopeptidase [Oscillospiraceae bacterium]
MSEKTNQLKEQLFYAPKNGYDRLPEGDMQKMQDFAEGYKAAMNAAKTEREFAVEMCELARQAGFEKYIPGKKLSAGDKVYVLNRDKALMLAVIGKEGLDKGANIFAAHIDSPRLDLKPCPVSEEGGMAFFKTHYYGGVKKYQWVTIPLELRGVFSLKNGENLKVCVGADEGDPIFTITDLLPHLAADQSKKSLAEGISGEALAAVVGSRPYDDKDATERIKLQAMKLIYDKYGVTEQDFLSAELSFVPAFNARDLGFDRSLIAAYGHDDRCCAYGCAKAVMEAGNPEKTLVCVLADKEEIGSAGVTGMLSQAFDTFMEDLCDATGATLRRCFENSFCLSADVSNGYDPHFPEVSDHQNNAKLNYGVSICKYTGARGKSGTSDASSEVMAKLRRIFDENEVIWQTAELGKVDQGGGGTVAQFMANRNIDTVDAGVPVLSMHAPYEVISKLDLYMTYKAVKAFCK